MSEENQIPVPDRLSRLESLLEKVLTAGSFAAPVLGVIPGAGKVVNTALAVGGVAADVLREVDGIEGNETVDAAALAAGNIGRSTGDAALDLRLAQIENLLLACVPIVKLVASHFGQDTSAIEANTAKPMGE